MKISEAGIALIKHFEGLYLHAYACPAGKLTIGWGCTAGVKPGMVITENQAEAMLAKELSKFEDAVTRLVKVPLTQHQFDCLCSFSFNVGVGNLQSSTLLKLLNQGDYAAVPAQLLRWDKYTNPKTKKLEVAAGLQKRRQAEANLWLPSMLRSNAPLPLIADPMPQSVQPPEKDLLMATATPVTTTTNAVTAAVESATLSIGSLWAKITGFIGSAASAGALGIFATVAPTQTAMITAILAALATAVSAAAHAYAIVEGVSATNNATLMMVENFINTVETGLGGKPFVFDNGDNAASS